jgi:hypothetical protein|tara:strand:- start:227 stop:1360 length:1134 start_codon:yes stop_codon:yes gene_type:complete
MAGTKTYLTLVNNVLQELNEVELTSSTFSSSRGIQTAVKTFVNKAVNDLYTAEVEWPWLYTSTTQDVNSGQQEYTFPTAFRKADFDSFYLIPKELVTNGEFTSNINNWTTIAGSGSASYSSTGNGRLLLNDFAAHQTISTVVNKTYRIQVRALDSVGTGQAFKIQVGTSAEDTTNLNTTLTVSDFGQGKIVDETFVATAQSTVITLNNPTTATNMLVDFVRVSEADIIPTKLQYVSYENYLQGIIHRDKVNSSDHYAKPQSVYRTNDNLGFGISPIPDRDTYQVNYQYYKSHTELSSATDTLDLPDIYSDTIVNRAKYYAYKLRSDIPSANIANAEYEDGVKRIRIEALNRQDYMKDTRVNVEMSSRGAVTNPVFTY